MRRLLRAELLKQRTAPALLAAFAAVPVVTALGARLVTRRDVA